MVGKIPSGSAPDRVKSSVWQMPVALISTMTSPALGPSRSTSTISSGLAFSNATAARVFIAVCSLPHAGSRRRSDASAQNIHAFDREGGTAVGGWQYEPDMQLRGGSSPRLGQPQKFGRKS